MLLFEGAVDGVRINRSASLQVLDELLDLLIPFAQRIDLLGLVALGRTACELSLLVGRFDVGRRLGRERDGGGADSSKQSADDDDVGGTHGHYSFLRAARCLRARSEFVDLDAASS